MDREEWTQKAKSDGWKVDTVWGGTKHDPVQYDVYELEGGTHVSVPRKSNYEVQIRQPGAERAEYV